MLRKRILLAALVFAPATCIPVFAQSDTSNAAAEKARRKAELQQQLELIQSELNQLDQAPSAIAPPRSSSGDGKATTLDVVVVSGQRLTSRGPLGQTVTTVDRTQFENSPAANIGDVLALSPGVTYLQGNGPRDASISVRGSNERQSFGVRNIKVFEDGFPVTQPDGLSRTDLTDPHAYGSIDVIRGPSSAWFGNYATGGAIDFHTRRGRDIQGVEAGVDFGSYDYYNDYVTAGGRGERYEYSAFLSNVRGNPVTAHTEYNTVTENLLLTLLATPTDRVTLKFINNDLDANLSLRLSLNQYRQNPYQKDCATLTTSDALAAGGCASISVFSNGFYSTTKQSLTPEQADLGRHDRRTIVGARWEHDFDAATTWRTQFVFDNRDYKQPTSATSGIGTIPSFNLMSDLIRSGSLLGRDSATSAGVFFNYENINSYSYNLSAGGSHALGGITQAIFGHHLNAGFRAREELALAPQWSAVAGVGGEFTQLNAQASNTSYNNATPAITQITGDRVFLNVAPEAALLYTPNTAWQFHARIATGYGTPQATNLFVTQQGVAGNNTQLKAQSNLGFDLGAQWTLAETLKASLTGFYEFYRNELVTQSAGASLQNFTFNAPSSEHRGVELGLDWHPLPALLPGAYLSAAYMYDNQVYAEYSEQLSAGKQSASFDRSGNRIPGVDPNYLNARLGYDQRGGVLRGAGGYIETNYRGAFYLDNANLLKAPSYTLLNLSLHYDPPAAEGPWSRLRFYFDVQNLLDRTYVASASNIIDSIDPGSGLQNGAGALSAATGSIYAGSPRAYFGGMRLKF